MVLDVEIFNRSRSGEEEYRSYPSIVIEIERIDRDYDKKGVL